MSEITLTTITDVIVDICNAAAARGEHLNPDEIFYSTAVKETWQRVLEQVRREGGKPYAIPVGASNHPLGGLGYANFADEVAAQEVQMGIFFDTVVTATCTGSTQAA